MNVATPFEITSVELVACPEADVEPVDFDGIVEDFIDTCALAKQGFLLNRDFRSIEVERWSLSRVLVRPGSWALMNSFGSGMFITWYLYHSPKYGRLFMIWKSENGGFGCRDDIGRITIVDLVGENLI